jgi:hypothetical protein
MTVALENVPERSLQEWRQDVEGAGEIAMEEAGEAVTIGRNKRWGDERAFLHE